ncbi:unnamed protein product [Anisakis simplex]|uniref:COesterase domain-containing protein n=1 Tax=Anisakis simplex TaxID=6269 RepID=A0A0M3KJF9_ANISI|nr:unnamed protein product [Anisakis simplex]
MKGEHSCLHWKPLWLLFIVLAVVGTDASEVQREFRVSELAPVGHIIGYISGSALIGLKAHYYIVYPDSSGQVENVSPFRILRRLKFITASSFSTSKLINWLGH